MGGVAASREAGRRMIFVNQYYADFTLIIVKFFLQHFQFIRIVRIFF